MKNHDLRISVIEPVGGHGGMNYYDFGLAGGLVDAGVDVVLHTCDETDISTEGTFEVRHTFKSIYGKSVPWKRGLRFLRGSIVALLSAVVERRHIVHFHFFHVGALQTMQVTLARLLMRKIVVTAHDVESFVAGLEAPVLSRMVYKLAHRVIAHNQISRTELIGRIGLNAEIITVIPHGNYLHAARILPPQANARQLLGIPGNAKVLLFFGQIKDVKGLDLLIEAMPEIIKNHPATVLLIAGKPWKSDFSIYDRLIEKLAVRNNCITNIRFIPDSEVPIYYSACDLVVLPYRRIYQSGVVLMAMSYGKAVLVSSLPGMTEIVHDGVNGFVFQSDRSDDLSAKLSEILGNIESIQRIAAKGKEYVIEKHDWHSIGEATAYLYRGMLCGKT
ncbi:MAG TPA: glycosyltransferase family 4 protein [Gallionella sp.]|nr:glycosyltransferase family 4 protein [Gallionella sp.]